MTCVWQGAPYLRRYRRKPTFKTGDSVKGMLAGGYRRTTHTCYGGGETRATMEVAPFAIFLLNDGDPEPKLAENILFFLRMYDPRCVPKPWDISCGRTLIFFTNQLLGEVRLKLPY